MDPVATLREIGFWLERSRADTHRVKAYRRAADSVEAMDAEERARRERENTWSAVAGLGPKTVAIITAALADQVPPTLAKLRGEGAEPLQIGGEELRAALKGDLHVHSNWSDGGSPLAEMMATAKRLGHSYCSISDHSPRLKIARGLSAERLQEQLQVIAELNDELAPFRVLRSIEVDILDDGSLDQTPEMLDQLDIVVASVHSHLASDSETMTLRMATAIANPRTNVLGHCTGRLVEGGRGLRSESSFDAEVVFEACRQFDVAVEINSRPERRDPPGRLIELASEMGCLFSIDTDAHAPGQLDFLDYGCARAAEHGIPAERIVNTWPVDELLAWAAHSR